MMLLEDQIRCELRRYDFTGVEGRIYDANEYPYACSGASVERDFGRVFFYCRS